MSPRAARRQTDPMAARAGNIKVTRQEWIGAAVLAIKTVPIDQLKILSLAADLSVSRSSFYWYFSGMGELQEELLRVWAQSTQAIVERTERTAMDITTACLGVYECWADRAIYNELLDFAVRDWGRRNPQIAERVYLADIERLTAMSVMFGRHDFDEADSMVRARLLYHSQLGYYAAGTDESIDMRLMFLPNYLRALTDVEPPPAVLETFVEYFRSIAG